MVELVPGGSKLPVSDANKVEFVNNRTHWALVGLVAAQLDAVRAGFEFVLPDFQQLGQSGRDFFQDPHGSRSDSDCSC
eukprot:SAG22_NODE_742_length_7506_cov_16.663561_8_plen_78_part_00